MDKGFSWSSEQALCPDLGIADDVQSAIFLDKGFTFWVLWAYAEGNGERLCRMKTRDKFLVLICLYFAQGLPYGFFTQALPIILRDMGASLPQIGAASLLALPWAFKFLWAPVIDSYGPTRFGRRKAWALIIQGATVLLFLVLGLLPQYEGFTYLAVGFLIASFLAASQDVAADGLAVSLLNSRERGIGNGIQVAGYRLGMIFGGGFILMNFTLLHWSGSFLVIAALLALTLLPIFITREPPPEHIEHPPMYRILVDFFARRGAWLWLVIIGFYKFGDGMASAMIKPYIRDMGLTVAEIGTILGTVGVAAGLAGAVLGGVAMRWLGRLPAALWFGVFQAVTVFSYWLLSKGILPDTSLVYLVGLEYFSGGTHTVAIFTIMMDACRKETGATDYTIQASLVVMVSFLSSFVGGIVAEYGGYGTMFLSSALACLAGVLVFVWCYRRFRVDGGIQYQR